MRSRADIGDENKYNGEFTPNALGPSIKSNDKGWGRDEINLEFAGAAGVAVGIDGRACADIHAALQLSTDRQRRHRHHMAERAVAGPGRKFIQHDREQWNLYL